MPPRWALGYHQARWSYGSEEEVRQVAEALRVHGIPADAIHLDIDHMDGFRVFTWDQVRFPDPAGLMADLRAMGFRITVVVDAAVRQDLSGYAVYEEGHARGYFVGGPGPRSEPELTAYQWGGRSVLPDHTRDEVRRWWGEQYQNYLDVGVAGFVNDMNEPALHDRPFDDPLSANWEPPPGTPFGEEGEEGTHAEVRNAYASLEARATAEGLERAQPDARPFLVTRSGSAGIQRSATVWTGDNGSYWEHLEMSLPQLLNLGLSGIPLSGADIGGFFGDCPPELLVRWMQLRAWYPFARGNAATGTARQEPWVWGEPTTSRCRRAFELRYRLLPYLYGVVREASRTGRPILGPLLFHYPANATAAAR
jgi:alpha-glucosidase